MNKDEAVKIVRETIGRFAWSSEHFVEGLIALGVLKMDKSPRDDESNFNASVNFVERLPGTVIGKTGQGPYVLGVDDAAILLQAIDRLGLRVVYKENANCPSWKSNYKSMNYAQLTSEVEKLRKRCVIGTDIYERMIFLHNELKIRR